MRTQVVKVSVIMPVYNAKYYLPESIGDIAAQTFDDFELICVDDGSTDGSGKILDDFARRDTRMRVIHQENRGGGAARNAGLKEAAGKWLLFLDADDRFDKEMLERVIDKAEIEACDVLVFGADTFDNVTGETKGAPWLIQRDSVQDGENPFSAVNTTVWNKLFRQEFVLQHHLEFTERKAAYSTTFVALALLYAHKITITHQILLHYRTNNPNSNIQNEDGDPTAVFEAMLEMRRRLEKDDVFDKYQVYFKELCTQIFLGRLFLLKTRDGFLQLYKLLHSHGISEMGLYDYNKTMTEIADKTAEEFLFDHRMMMQKYGLLRQDSYLLDYDGLPRVAIYGGGNVGVDFFRQAMQRSDLEIVGWVDRNYQSIGFPLQAPDRLKEMDFDAVIIAVNDQKRAEAIRETVKDMGIAAERIYWREPKRV